MEQRPWIGGYLVLTREVLDAVDAHARECYPDESCGLLTGPASEWFRVDGARACTNLAARYHALDPETYPRTAREAYIIDGMLMQRALDEGDRSGRPVKVIYHSHCDVGAYFSAEDRLVAAPDGLPVYPVVYLVTSVRAGGVVDEHRLYAFRDGAWTESSFILEA